MPQSAWMTAVIQTSRKDEGEFRSFKNISVADGRENSCLASIGKKSSLILKEIFKFEK